MYALSIRHKQGTDKAPTRHLQGCRSFVTRRRTSSSSSSSCSSQVKIPHRLLCLPTATPPFSPLVSSAFSSSKSYVFTVVALPGAEASLSPCQVSTSPTTTATRRCTPRECPYPRPPAPVPRSWGAYTTMALWYVDSVLRRGCDACLIWTSRLTVILDRSRYQSHQWSYSRG